MSQQKTGEQVAKDLQTSQRNFSLSDVLYGEQWMLQNGLITETSGDTLLGYAYMQKDVAKVELKIDLDLQNNGQQPKLSYTVHLTKRQSKRYHRMCRLAKSKSLFGKLHFLLLLKLGSPIPGVIEDNVTYLAKEYLPSHYKVEVNVK